MAESLSPGVLSIKGAWNTDPAWPNPTRPTGMASDMRVVAPVIFDLNTFQSRCFACVADAVLCFQAGSGTNMSTRRERNLAHGFPICTYHTTTPA